MLEMNDRRIPLKLLKLWAMFYHMLFHKSFLNNVKLTFGLRIVLKAFMKYKAYDHYTSAVIPSNNNERLCKQFAIKWLCEPFTFAQHILLQSLGDLFNWPRCCLVAVWSFDSYWED